MKVCLTIAFSEDGTPTTVYTGLCADGALSALAAAEATGLYRSAIILRNPDPFRSRRFTPPPAEVAVPSVEAVPAAPDAVTDDTVTLEPAPSPPKTRR